VELDKFPKFAEDPIPENAIRLREAFQRIQNAIAANPTLAEQILDEYAQDWKDDLNKIEERFKA
jgi:hypothetical protein